MKTANNFLKESSINLAETWIDSRLSVEDKKIKELRETLPEN